MIFFPNDLTNIQDIRKLLPPGMHIDTLRFRSVPIDENAHIPKREAILSKQFNHDIGEKNCYVVMKSEEDAHTFVDYLNEDNRKNALGGGIVKVTLAGSKDINVKLSVFIGNISYGLIYKYIIHSYHNYNTFSHTMFLFSSSYSYYQIPRKQIYKNIFLRVGL